MSFFPRKNRLRIRKPNRLISSSLRASSPFWASEASLARTCERAAKPRGAEERPSAPRSRVLARLTLLAQIGELARRLHILLAHPSYLPRFPLFHPTLRASTYGEVRDLSFTSQRLKVLTRPSSLSFPGRLLLKQKELQSLTFAICTSPIIKLINETIGTFGRKICI